MRRVTPESASVVSTLGSSQSLITASYAMSVAVALTLCFFGKSFLPQTFFNDSDTFQAIMASPSRLNAPDDTYAAIARVYAILGLDDARALVGAATLGLFVLMQLVALPLAHLVHAGPVLLGAYLLSPVLVSVFLAGFSKDALAIIVVLAFVTPRDRQLGWILVVGVGGLFALAIRPYWLLILGLAMILRLALRHSSRQLVAVVLAAPLVLVIAFNLALGVPITFYRDDVVNTLAIEADSTITNLLPSSDPVSQLINSYYFLALLLCPLLAGLTEPHQIGAALLITVTWFGALSSLSSSARATETSLSAAVQDFVCLALGALLVFSIFEPDFGSYTRHLLPFLPLLLAAWTASARSRALQ